MSQRHTFSISMPIGGWSPGLPAVLRSLKAQDAQTQIAFCDVSKDERVIAACDESGIEFAHRRHGPDGGQSDAIIEGWNNTGGDILAWLNVDDVLTPWALKEAEEAFAADPDLDVFFGESTILDADGSTTGVHPAVQPPGDILLRSCTISQPSCFFKRSAVERAGGLQAERHFTMDWDLWVRLYRQGSKFKHTPSFFSAVLFEKGTKTSSLPMQRYRELFSIVESGAGRYAAWKSMIGFTMHHWASYTPLNPLVRSLRKAGLLWEHKPGSSGMTGSGRVRGQGALPVLNLTDTPQSVLEVELAGAGAPKAWATLGGIKRKGPVARFEFDTPVAPTEAVTIGVDASETRQPVLFQRARWVEA
jgi:cellulose synthase/poly-beta-1,6-N-acetylglucosamine synthase-like glycosyltransferase